MNRLGTFVERCFPIMAKLCAVGVVLAIVGHILGIGWLYSLGGIMTAPMTMVAGAACLAVVLLAPTFPFAAIAERIPKWMAWPFMVVSVVIMLAWWALWAFIATGALSTY